MAAVLLDTHVVHWWSAEPERIAVSIPIPSADRMVYATAVENSLELVSKDRAMREHQPPRPFVVW